MSLFIIIIIIYFHTRIQNLYSLISKYI